MKRIALLACEFVARAALWIAERLNEREEMDVEVIKRDSNGQPREAKLIHEGISIVAQKRGFADWEPLYGEKNGEKIDLPSCFSLNAEALKTLEAAS